jgi:hypothetical protein
MHSRRAGQVRESQDTYETAEREDNAVLVQTTTAWLRRALPTSLRKIGAELAAAGPLGSLTAQSRSR